MTGKRGPKVKGHQGQRSRSNVDFNILSLKAVIPRTGLIVNITGQVQRSEVKVTRSSI